MQLNFIDIFRFQNPWRIDPHYKVTPYFHRTILHQIEKWLNEPEIIVLLGPRQSGKTTILMKLTENMLTQKIPPQAIFYFNCDSVLVQSLFENTTDFISFINQMTDSNRPIIIIDEIQRLTNPGLFLKEIYDLKLGYKILVSGSSSLEVRSKIKETLTGRKILFNILPFDFTEFLSKDAVYSSLIQTLPNDILENYSYFDHTWGGKLEKDLEQFLSYGGYPRVLLTHNLEKKKQILSEIFTSYIQKDVSDFMRIENIPGFNKLVQILALTSGQIINKSDIALNSGLNHQTLEKYLQILQDTFILESVIPFFTNKIKEIVKNPKFYFIDSGLRNFAVTNFNTLSLRSDRGFLQESFVFRELKTLVGTDSKLKFWRTKVGAEIDFIIDKGTVILPIECKSLLKKPIISRGFRNFLKLYTPPKGIVINSNLFDRIKIENSEIVFIPYHWFFILGDFFLKHKNTE